MIAIGDVVEWKREGDPSLGPWRVGTLVVRLGRGGTVRDKRGREHPATRVREVKTSKRSRPAPRARMTIGVDVGGPSTTVRTLVRPPTVRLASEAIDRAIAKRGAWRSTAYLDYIRALPCCVCGAPPFSDPSHHGRHATSRKPDDFTCVPMCREHHGHFHQHGVLPGRTREQTDIFVERTAFRLLGSFLKRHELVPITFTTERR